MNSELLINVFKTPAHGYAFALAFLDGQIKLEVLGVTMAHYRCLELAAEWYAHIKVCLASNADALVEAQLMYREMIAR